MNTNQKHFCIEFCTLLLIQIKNILVINNLLAKCNHNKHIYLLVFNFIIDYAALWLNID